MSILENNINAVFDHNLKEQLKKSKSNLSNSAR